jgi:VWFA-related protein
MSMKALTVRGLVGGLGLCLLGVSAAPRQDVVPPQHHESVVINIEVPLRVLKNDAFVDGLTLADFEVCEDGILQPIEAVYLISDRQVLWAERAAGASPPAPLKARHYVLYLDLKEYLSKAGEALDFFFDKVLGDEDSLFVVTPVKTYTFRHGPLSSIPRQKISERLKSILRKDIQTGNSKYRNLMRDFYQLEQTEYPAELADLKERMLFELAAQMRDLIEITDGRMMGVADALKALAGEKHVFMVYQKDVLPDHAFEDDMLMQLIRPPSFDVDQIMRIFSDASITIHFLYITKTPAFAVKPENVGRLSAAFSQPDLSSDIYAAFKEMARATGGMAESTANPDFGLRQAAAASSHYYILYYRPLHYRADGRFQKIDVRVKGRNVKVIHRLGYIAD